MPLASQAQQSHDDPYLYYRVDGYRAVPPPANTQSTLNFGTSGLAGFSCSNFDPKSAVQNMLGGLTDSNLSGLVDLQSIPSQLLSQMPGQILCRAQPTLCQLSQHYSVRAEDSFRFSMDLCSQTTAAAGGTQSDWMQIAKAQEWQRQAQRGASASEASKAVAEEDDPCITWVGGKTAGCSGHPPIKPLRDAVKAGWCVVHQQDAACSGATGSASDTHAGSIWPEPEDAALFVADIVGDSEIKNNTVAGSRTPIGLQSMVKSESKKKIADTLTAIVDSGGFATTRQMKQIESPAVRVDRALIVALRIVDEQRIYVHRIAEEIALSRVLNKALLARRLLIKGMREPNIQGTEPAAEDVANPYISRTQLTP